MGEVVMRRKRIQKTCSECGSAFKVIPSMEDRFVTCSKECQSVRKSRIRMGELHPLWKGEEGQGAAGNMRARRHIPLPPKCERCGAAKPERHHMDENPHNNDPRNIAFLCRRCHMIVDGRMFSRSSGDFKRRGDPIDQKTA